MYVSASCPSPYNTGLRFVYTGLFTVLSMDFSGPIPITKISNRYILVCVEYFTGWSLAIPTIRFTAEVVIRFIQDQIIYSFGRPRVIVTANASCFTAGVLTDYIKLNGFDWKTVLTYVPMSNCRAARMVWTINQAIKNMILESWED